MKKLSKTDRRGGLYWRQLLLGYECNITRWYKNDYDFETPEGLVASKRIAWVFYFLFLWFEISFEYEDNYCNLEESKEGN
jgi:hypothetical protein